MSGTGDAIGQMLPYAAGVAVSPLPIIAVILVLFSSRARTGGPAFLAGSLLGVAVATTVSFLLAGGGTAAPGWESATWTHWVRVGLGLLLLFAAVRHWQRHRRHARTGGEHPMPRWMSGVDRWSPLKTALLALVMYGLDPKNLALCAKAGQELAAHDPTWLGGLLALAVFTAAACLPVLVVVLGYLAGGARAARALEHCRTWLSRHHLLVMAALLLAFGALLLSHGLRGLL
ncbi:GAP family protein [Catellatospora tritici]|uniref:GAP family protein n=1 Tax=Catellatospora tritici TaxID=2851566 RepID=UPI001C2D9775|nr:GAP family protein [Catellatospora tritici]MBV1855316.1 GAP family protein [Catellatospora tritici]